MTVAVPGASGFIGRHIVPALAQGGRRVHAVLQTTTAGELFADAGDVAAGPRRSRVSRSTHW